MSTPKRKVAKAELVFAVFLWLIALVSLVGFFAWADDAHSRGLAAMLTAFGVVAGCLAYCARHFEGPEKDSESYVLVIEDEED